MMANRKRHHAKDKFLHPKLWRGRSHRPSESVQWLPYSPCSYQIGRNPRKINVASVNVISKAVQFRLDLHKPQTPEQFQTCDCIRRVVGWYSAKTTRAEVNGGGLCFEPWDFLNDAGNFSLHNQQGFPNTGIHSPPTHHMKTLFPGRTLRFSKSRLDHLICIAAV